MAFLNNYLDLIKDHRRRENEDNHVKFTLTFYTKATDQAATLDVVPPHPDDKFLIS